MVAATAVIRQQNAHARSERRRVRSDWMAVERKRCISVSSAVMSSEHERLAFNLLDMPGHQDFSHWDFSHWDFKPIGISAGTPIAP
jgi:peptide chain release factor 3